MPVAAVHEYSYPSSRKQQICSTRFPYWQRSIDAIAKTKGMYCPTQSQLGPCVPTSLLLHSAERRLISGYRPAPGRAHLAASTPIAMTCSLTSTRKSALNRSLLRSVRRKNPAAARPERGLALQESMTCSRC